MRTFSLLVLALATSSAFSTANAQFSIGWDFTEDAQDWNVADLAPGGPYDPPLAFFPVAHQVAGGDFGGYIRATDPSPRTFAFNAPIAQLGNWSNFAGGMLGFSLRCTNPGPVEEPGLILVGGDVVLVADITPPGEEWTQYQVRLAPVNFRKYGGGAVTPAEFMSVMSSLTALRIPGDYGSEQEETTSLDSVLVMAPQTDPVLATPGRVILFLVALGAAAAFVLRRRTRLPHRA